ncbi:MAG: ATP-binding protein [Bacillota bacterium]
MEAAKAETPPLNKKGFRISLVIKVTALTAISIALVSAVSNLIIFNLSFDALKNEIRNNLILLASNASVVVDGEKLKSIKTLEDEGSEIYLELQQKLQQVQEASRIGTGGDLKLRYVYTVAKSGSEYIYVLDAVPIGDDEHSSVGDLFPIEDYPEAVNGFRYATADYEALADEEFGGMVQSGYAPIKDSKGNIVGMIAIDMDVSVLKEKEAAMRTARQIAVGIGIVLALLLGVLFSSYITRPIIILTKGTRKVAEGNLDTVVTVKRKDELGELANSFNNMTCDLKASNEALRKYNLELEEKVAKRTADLSQINKEIKDILDNMSQAIFTIDPKFNFNAQHSRYAFDIFGNVDFAERSLLDIFFQREDQKTDREKMSTWLTKVFTNTDITWGNLEALQPVREIKINVQNDEGKTIDKYITVKFEPITDVFAPGFKSKITKVMVIVQDITETKNLQIEMQKKEQEYKDNINQIVEIIKMDKELFQDFITECKESLVSFEPKLIKLRDNKNDMDIINDLFRIMHTIKGNARAFNLERIAGEAHSIENIFSSIKKGEQIMTDELLKEIFKKLDYFNTLFNETLDIYDKIVHGRNVDMGKTRSKERVKADSEVVKVRIGELNRLSELIRKADRLIYNDAYSVITTHAAKKKVQEIETIIKETEKHIVAMRKIEMGRLFTRFPRLVHDVSRELGKKVRLVMSGEDVQVDKNIFDCISDPLIHIVRNSLGHGIEKPDERLKADKPEEGTIEISTLLTNDGLIVEIADDGKGLDIDRIRAKAVKKGLINPGQALEISDDEVISLIFAPGFSTNDNVTNISGRGVGMDIVKSSIEEHLKGNVFIETKKGQGLKITLKIPLTV